MKTPEGWQSRAIADLLADDAPGFWGEAPSGDGDVAVVRSTNLRSDGTLDLSDTAYRRFPQNKVQRKLLELGDILLERSGGGPKQPVGRVALFEGPGVYCFNNFMQRLRAAEGICHHRYLLYLLWSLHARGITEMLQQATTGIRNLNYHEYLKWKLPLPPLPEQKKIAEILGSVDEAIRATKALIEQTRRVKQGLLQQLLTRGIGHTRFKMTEIGEIPESWEVMTVEEMLPKEAIKNGLYRPASDYGEGTPIVRIDDFDPGDSLRGLPRKKVALADAVVREFQVEQGDIFLNRVNSISHLGKVCLVDWAPPDLVFESNMMCIRVPERSPVANDYLFLLLSSHLGRQQILASAKRAIAQASINQADVLGFSFPVPPIPEQCRINTALKFVEDSVGAAKTHLLELTQVKDGVMSALLSGQVRVAV